MPTQEQLDNFWNGLQKTLNDAGADLDLQRPEDLMRIRVMHISNADLKTYEADVTSTMPFSENPDVDVTTVSEKDLVAMQKPGKPSNEKLTELYNAAREGRLFFNSLQESGMTQRQLISDSNGKTSVLPDSAHQTPEMMEISGNNVPPRKPDYLNPGIGTRIAAFFGSKKAKKRIHTLEQMNERSRASYEKKLENYNRVQKNAKGNPEFYQQIYNGNFVAINYTQVPMDDDARLREVRLADMGTHAHKAAVADGIKEIVNASIESNSKALAEKAKNAETVTPEIKQHIAEIFYMKALDNHLDAKMSYLKTPERDFKRLAEQAVKGSPAYKRNFDIMCGERFNKALEDVKPADLKAFAADPAAAAEKMYSKLVVGIKDAPAQQSKLQMEKVQVKETAKEAPDAASAFKL